MADISKLTLPNNVTYDIKDTVSEFGGTNLIKNSNVTQSVTNASAWGYSTWKLVDPACLNVGDILIASADVTPGTSDTWTASTFYLYNAVSDDGARNKSATVLGEIINGRAKAILTVNSNYTNYTDLLVYYGTAGQCAGHNGTITNVKLERGNKATDWTLAPQDLVKVSETQLQFY